jgi:cell division protein FtsZ
MIHFDLPKDQSSIIKVIGVGGGGSNAVNHMFSQNIAGVDFIICNTDSQAVAQSKVPNKIQLGPHLTQGLGAGANPSIGRQATEESLEEIKRILEVNTKMAFITAGMGGGTGTGGAPIIASICKELGILTVGIVTTPFTYEGKKRVAQAEAGVMLLKEHVDTLLVISNDKLRHQFGNLKMKEAFNKADDILATAAKCITDVISSTGQINVDFADVCTVMRNGGVAILGSATAAGENRAHLAVENALTSPLLNDNDIRGAKWILININSAEGENEFTMDEVEIIQNYILTQAGEDTDVILGLGYDNNLGADIGITLIATGFEHKDPFAKKNVNNIVEQQQTEKVVMHLNMVSSPSATQAVAPAQNEVKENLPTPAQQLNFVLNEPQIDDAFMPKLVQPNATATPLNTNVSQDEKVHFEISNSNDHAPIVHFDTDFVSTPQVQSSNVFNEQASNQNVFKSNINNGGFLAKPSQIYADDSVNKNTTPINFATPTPMPQADQNLPEEPMQLFVKNNVEQQATPTVEPVNNNIAENISMLDETEQLRKRAAERIAKLRNLSFNINAADPNNEFEAVPAYLRRNMDMHNQIADVESFYSNYTVKSDENNQANINTLNNFLEGKKPD